jgi:SAM-dependent methyltransferase
MTEREDVIAHFVARAATYDRSSSWCTDDALNERIVALAAPDATSAVLDVGCGTGLVSRFFKGRTARVVGVDISTEMTDQALPHLDELVIAPAERMPFPTGEFDIVVSRQGIQFMLLPDAVQEMVRVAKPGGRVVLVNLCAYGPADRDEYFEILRLRNPVRRNFFLPEDLEALLRGARCDTVTLESYVSTEDVDLWADNGAIDGQRQEALRDVYRRASPAFRELHGVSDGNGRLVDRMLFIVAMGRKPW